MFNWFQGSEQLKIYYIPKKPGYFRCFCTWNIACEGQWIIRKLCTLIKALKTKKLYPEIRFHIKKITHTHVHNAIQGHWVIRTGSTIFKIGWQAHRNRGSTGAWGPNISSNYLVALPLLSLSKPRLRLNLCPSKIWYLPTALHSESTTIPFADRIPHN